MTRVTQTEKPLLPTRNEQDEALARIRRMSAQPRDDGRRRPHVPYKRAHVLLFENVELDPARPVLSAWKDTPYDFATGHKQEGNYIDAGDGLGVSDNSGGPYLVRSIHRPTLGEVKSVDAVSYWVMKMEASGGLVTQPRWEPVPDDTKLCGPIFPPNFPSAASKARALAARGLRKPAEELTFEEILGWFRSPAASARPVFKQG